MGWQARLHGSTAYAAGAGHRKKAKEPSGAAKHDAALPPVTLKTVIQHTWGEPRVFRCRCGETRPEFFNPKVGHRCKECLKADRKALTQKLDDRLASPRTVSS